MRAFNTTRLLCAITLITAGLAIPLAGTASAVDINKPISANGPAMKLKFKDVGDNASIDFSGLKNQVLKVTTSGGSYAANCDVMISVLRKTDVIVAPFCGGIAGTTGDFTTTKDSTYTIKVDTQGHAPAGLKVALTSTGTIRSITPSAEAVTYAVAASTTTDFGFIGKAGQRLSATTDGGTFVNDCHVTITLIAPDSSVLGYNTCAGKDGYIAALDSVGAGKYILRVQNTNTATGSVNLQVFQFKDKTAPITANGPAVAGKVSAPGQSMGLTFSGTAGQRISWLVTASDLGGYVELFKPDGTTSSMYTTAAVDEFSDGLALTATGTWTLRVYGDSAKRGSATVKLYTFTDVDGGTIVANGPTKSLTIATPGQHGSFTFAGTTGQKISFQVTASDLTGYVELYKPDGTYGGDYVNASAGAFSDAFTLTTTGTWSFFVHGGGSADTGSVTVRLYTFSDVSGGTIVANGPPKSVTITTPGQRGTLTFSGTAGQQISYAINASDLTGFVELYKPDGTYAGSYVSSNATAFGDSFTLGVTGTWTFKIYAGGSADTGSVQMELYTFADTTTTITVGASKVVAASTPGQNAKLTFAGTAGNSRTVSVTTSSLVGYVEFHRPDGSYAGGYACLAVGCTSGAFTLNVTGTWTLLVDASGPDTGTATIKLT